MDAITLQELGSDVPSVYLGGQRPVEGYHPSKHFPRVQFISYLNHICCLPIVLPMIGCSRYERKCGARKDMQSKDSIDR